MKHTQNSSVESCTLMSLIYRELDDRDYKNALLLSERLYAIDRKNSQYQYMYASCLFQNLDYNASYTVLKTVKSIPCLNLFAKSCLELGGIEESVDKQRELWEEGVEAVRLALSLDEWPHKVYWGDELASSIIRHHTPSEASLYNLLGDLYLKLDNVRAASVFYWRCLKMNPYKISTFMKLCDIAPDNADFNTSKLPKDVFTEFDLATTDLSRSPHSYLPSPPLSIQSDISFNDELRPSVVEKNGWSMPELKNEHYVSAVDQLRALVKFSPKVLDDDDDDYVLKDEDCERGEIEENKDMIIDSIKTDIQNMKANEAYRNKHGLHKRPPVQVPQELKVDLAQSDENEDESNQQKRIYDTIQRNTAPRIRVKRPSEDSPSGPNKRPKILAKTLASLQMYFLPTDAHADKHYLTEEVDTRIIEGMNNVLRVIRIMANAYLHQSFYNCEYTALELQKLDDRQYNSPRVLSILGKAYYDSGDHESASAFFRQSFLIAPWYCECVPLYSTALWYLEKEKELNLLAFKLKDNPSHRFEAYVAAGNWTKCVKGGSEATQWFQKAVKQDPSRSYGHALLGYEEWEKGNSLGAKQHFSRCMIANKRSYLGWYGMATAYQGMEEYVQARALLNEAVRLHPRHPIVLSTMAEVLYELELYDEAKEFIDKSLAIKASSANERLKEKIEMKIEMNEPNLYATGEMEEVQGEQEEQEEQEQGQEEQDE